MSPMLDLETLVLLKGAHQQKSTEMCIMEAVAYVANEPWSDHPVCDNQPSNSTKGFLCANSQVSY
jgi:hypothetical protein